MASPRPGPLTPECQELLDRVGQVKGVSDRKIQSEAGLHGTWLNEARAGKVRPGAPSWAKLAAWLEGRQSPPTAPPPPPSAKPKAGGSLESRLLDVLVGAVGSNADNLKRVADTLGVKPQQVTAAMARLSATGSAPVASEPVASELAALVREATTHRRIGKALERLALELVLGKLEPRLAAGLESILESRGKSLRDERIERGMAKVAALRILLPSELALLERRRAAVALPPLAPGEKPLPPDEAPERIVADCPTCAGSSVLVVVRPRPPAPPVAPAGPLS